MKTKEEKLWNYLVKELAELKDNNYKARKIFDKVQLLMFKGKDAPKELAPQQADEVVNTKNMTKNVENWTYKSKAEIEALDDETLFKVYKELAEAIKLFHNMHTPITDEMYWQLMVIPSEVSKRSHPAAS